MSSDWDAVKRVVEAFERSDWQEIDVRRGDLRVHLAAAAPTTPAPTTASSPATAAVAPMGTTTDESDDSEPEDQGGGEVESVGAAPVSVPPGARVVTAPCPGTFWRAPEPGAPPFTEVGRRVDPGATLCIVEVMKLMNHVKAGLDGEVAAIYVENGTTVAKEEPLFAVVPAAETGTEAEGSSS